MDALKVTNEIGAKGATHPRVDLKDIEEAIAAEFTTTLDRAYKDHPHLPAMAYVTLHTIVMKNGFMVIGKSAPASVENYDSEKGFTFAREDAIRQLWPLMAFALKDRVYHGW